MEENKDFLRPAKPDGICCQQTAMKEMLKKFFSEKENNINQKLKST